MLLYLLRSSTAAQKLPETPEDTRHYCSSDWTPVGQKGDINPSTVTASVGGKRKS